MTSNYKEELLEAAGNLFEHGAHSSNLNPSEYITEKIKWLDNFTAAIDRLNASTIGRDEKGLPIDDFYRTEQEIRDYYRDRETRDQLRSELRQAFGLTSKDEEKSDGTR